MSDTTAKPAAPSDFASPEECLSLSADVLREAEQWEAGLAVWEDHLSPDERRSMSTRVARLRRAAKVLADCAAQRPQ
jgi:hypothetical protein